MLVLGIMTATWTAPKQMALFVHYSAALVRPLSWHLPVSHPRPLQHLLKVLYSDCIFIFQGPAYREAVPAPSAKPVAQSSTSSLATWRSGVSRCLASVLIYPAYMPCDRVGRAVAGSQLIGRPTGERPSPEAVHRSRDRARRAGRVRRVSVRQSWTGAPRVGPAELDRCAACRLGRAGRVRRVSARQSWTERGANGSWSWVLTIGCCGSGSLSLS